MLTKTDSENPAVLDIRAWVDISSPRLDEAIRHFELAWMALPDDRARLLAEDEAVARDRHYLLGVRRFRPFMLSPAEERVLSARDASAVTRGKPSAIARSARSRPTSTTARASGSGRSRSRVGPALPSRPRRAAARAEDDDWAVRTRSARARALLRLARRRSACGRPPAWPQQPHGSDEPRERDRRRRGRGAARRVRGPRRDRASVVPPEGGAAGPRAAGRRRPAGRGRRRAVAALGRGPPAGRGHVRGRDARARQGGRKLLLRKPDRRRAEAGKPSMAFCVWPSTRVPGFVFVN